VGESGTDPHGLVPPERLHETELFRFGVDLFNRSYFWEAHEAWETLWQSCPEGPTRQGLQGLIQLAAANLKEALRVPSGAGRLADAACRRLDEAGEAGALPGIDLGSLTRRAREHFEAVKQNREPNVPSPGIRMTHPA
jgi:predicted metal-dependent hydrolase